VNSGFLSIQTVKSKNVDVTEIMREKNECELFEQSTKVETSCTS